MCGIVGKLCFDSEPVSLSLLMDMTTRLAHRGPDSDGVYLRGPIGLGHRRLSIIDLASGHQPLANEDDTVWIVFNGEIYNFLELREILIRQGHAFKTRSDTEVIVHLYEQYGVRCLEHLNGMFAFAIWDEPRQRLFLARDRMGEKPLVYALTSRGISFASEIQALLQDPDVPRELHLQAIDLYMSHLYIPAPLSIFRGVRKLPPAHYLVCEAGRISIERYWQVDFGAKTSLSEPEAVEAVSEMLRDSVRRRLISEVPLGAFLSGGLDSGTMVALMSQVTSEPARTFSVGFEGNDIENHELPYAKQVADRYGTQHTEIWVRPDMSDILARLVRHYGEPFGDGSAIPTYYISQVARQHVTVAIAGDGGDELFGGYGRYTAFAGFDLTREVRKTLVGGVRQSRDHLAAGQIRQSVGAIKGIASWWLHLAEMARDPVRRYGQLTSYYFWGDMHRQVYSNEMRRATARFNPQQPYYDRLTECDGWTDLDKIFYLDHTTYLPDDILAKVDIASMACSLETRAPFLDHRLVELAASLPEKWKVAGGQTKRILRQVVAEWLPADILSRPKVGFGLPIRRWMQDDLYPLAADLLTSSRFYQRGYFDPTTVAALLDSHRRGEADYGNHLYLLLVFELWAREVLDQAPAHLVAREEVVL